MAHGVSGLYVKKPNRPDKSIASQLRLVSLTRPDILVIVCGSNDLSSSVCNIHQLVTDLISVARYCLHAGVKRVIISQHWPRSADRYPGFWDRAVVFTEHMSRRVQGEHAISFWRQQCLWHSPKPVLLADGCHLNTRGTKIFLRNIRGAILQGIKTI